MPGTISIANTGDQFLNSTETSTAVISGSDFSPGQEIVIEIGYDSGATTLDEPVIVGDDGKFEVTGFDWSTIPNGAIQVSALDPNDILTTVSNTVEFTLDTEAPAKPILSLFNDTGPLDSDNVTRLPDIKVETPLGFDGTIEYQFGTPGFSTVKPTFASDGSDDGKYTVDVRLKDEAGNVSETTSLTFVLDTVDPDAPKFTPAAAFEKGIPVGTEAKTIIGTVTGDESGLFGFKSSLFAVDSDHPNSDGSFNLYLREDITAAAGETINLLIRTTDLAGNSSELSDYDLKVLASSDTGGTTPTPQQPVTEGTAGNDNIAVGTSTDPVFGGAGTDRITATPAAGTTAQLFGGSAENDPNDGGDIISVSGAGSAVVYGNGGNDVITVTSTGSATVYGGMNDDQVTVTNNADNSVVGGMGADTIAITGNGNNQVLGGSLVNDPNDGADRITISGNGNNTIYANGGDDTIVITGSGSNTVYAGVGNDSMTGGTGNDLLVGGRGDNVYTGGAGSDTFVFTAGSRDIVTDFSFAEGDRLDVGGQAYNVTTASDGSAALVFADGGVIILQGVTQAEFAADFVA